MSERPACSVVVPTRDRPDAAPRRASTGIAALDYPRERLQVIVVDDGGTSPTRRRRRLRRRVRRPRIASALPARRNAGVERAEGELLAFIDDDCRPRPDWLARLVARWQEAPTRPWAATRSTRSRTSLYAEAAQLVIDVGYAQNSAPERRWFTTNNLLVPADGFRALGGFDASYRTAEDRDFCARWLESGRADGVRARGGRRARAPHGSGRVRRHALSLRARRVSLPPRPAPARNARRRRALVLRRSRPRSARPRRTRPRGGARGTAPRLARGEHGRVRLRVGRGRSA